jgi:hypothetical protein
MHVHEAEHGRNPRQRPATYDDVVTDLAERYGTASRGQRWVVSAAAAVAALVVLVFVVWSFLDEADPEVRSQLTSYDVPGPHEATAELTVVRASPDVVATCRLRALAADHSVVGETEVTVGSGPERRAVEVTLRTEREAVTVASDGCTAPGQTRPR